MPLAAVDKDSIFVITFAEDPGMGTLSADRFLSITLRPRGSHQHVVIATSYTGPGWVTYAFLAPLAGTAGFRPSRHADHVSSGDARVLLIPNRAWARGR